MNVVMLRRTAPFWNVRILLAQPSLFVAGAAIILLAAACRLLLMATIFANVDSDQAVLGLMALHIQQGERPTFFYAQAYNGSLEAYVVAVAFGLFGAGDFVLRLPALASTLLFISLVVYLAMLLYGYRVAMLAGMFLAVGPGFFISWGTTAGTNYGEIMVGGTLLLILCIHYPRLWTMPWTRAAGFGAVAGLGLWLQPIMSEYLLTIALVYAWRLFEARTTLGTPAIRAVLLKRVGAMVLGFVVGALPLLVYNVQHRGLTLMYLLRSGGSGGNHLSVLFRLFTESLPILLGFAVPANEYGLRGFFAQQVGAHPWQYAVGVVLGVFILVRILLHYTARFWPVYAGSRMTLKRPHIAVPSAVRRYLATIRGGDRRPPADDVRDRPLALFFAVCLLFFLGTGYGAMYSATVKPYYLLPLYTATPLVLRRLLPARPLPRDWTIAGAMMACIVAFSLSVTLTTPSRSSIGGLDAYLESRGIRFAYVADYWLAYRISFETHERVVAIDVSNTGVRPESLRWGLVRRPRDIALGEHTPLAQQAWVFSHDYRREESLFQQMLKRIGVTARRDRWDDGIIYTHLSRPIWPAGPLRYGENLA